MEQSRLEKLLSLLDAKNAIVRHQAAQQIGDISRCHSAQLATLLKRLRNYIKNPNSWEARVASALALKEICRNLSTAAETSSIETEAEETSTASSSGDHLGLDTFSFDLNVALAADFRLLGSEDKIFDADCQTTSANRGMQRSLIAQQLGFFDSKLFDLSEFVTDEDFVYQQSPADNHRTTRKRSEESGDDAQLRPTKKMFKLETIDERKLDGCEVSKEVFGKFLYLLCADLYDPNWSARHGAALALLQIASSSHFAEFLRYSPPSIAELLRHVFNVLAVDRFNDFVGDHVVAPVRETCAQLVAALLAFLLRRRQSSSQTPASEGTTPVFDRAIKQVLAVCTQFIETGLDFKEWECRHSGLLAAKYVVGTIQQSGCSLMFHDQLWILFDAIVRRLEDTNDDVVICAAQALLPLANVLRSVQPQKVQEAVEQCWQLLRKQISSNGTDVGQNGVEHMFQPTADDSASDGLFQLLESSPEPLAIDDSRLALLVPFFWHPQTQTRRRLCSVLVRSARSGTLALSDITWSELLGTVFHRCLVDDCRELADQLSEQLWPWIVAQRSSERLWTLCRPVIGQWLACIMISEQTSLNGLGEGGARRSSEAIFIGGKEALNCDEPERDRLVVDARLRGARLIAAVCRSLLDVDAEPNPCQALTQLIALHLASNSASQRLAVCMFLCVLSKMSTGETHQCLSPFFAEMRPLLEELLTRAASSAVIYDEVLLSASELNAACREFLRLATDSADPSGSTVNALMLNAKEAQEACSKALHKSLSSGSASVSSSELSQRYEQLMLWIRRSSAQMERINLRVFTWLACAHIRIGAVPTKFNPVVKPLMDCLKEETNPAIVDEAASCLALLLEVAPGPSAKIVRNLSVLHCSDPSTTPRAPESTEPCEETKIISWESKTVIENGNSHEADTAQAAVTVSNTGLALKRIVGHFKNNLSRSFAVFYECLVKPVILNGEQNYQELINSMQILETVYGALTDEIRERIRISQIDQLCNCLQSKLSSVRHMAARCLTSLAKADLAPTLNFLLPKCFDLLTEECEDRFGKIGVTEMFYLFIERMGTDLIGLLPVLAVPTLSGMSSPIQTIRPVASYTFGQFVKLMPLESDDRWLPGLSTELTALRRERLEFLQLLNRPSTLSDTMAEDNIEKRASFLNDVTVNAELRSYQRDGVVWLRFLAEYRLHGILCDDMGLGKTLQTLIAVACSITNSPKKPSLIVCPKTLISHWANEIKKFFGDRGTSVLRPTTVIDRSIISNDILVSKEENLAYNVVITSYDMFRKEPLGAAAESLLSKNWHYCILDEGHAIRNPKTRLFRALVQLNAEHRLILSGTPVQNSVLELWSLFEFLMPGYLGTKTQFQARFGKPILLSREAKASSIEAEAGQKALENLHKLALPFILRRRKCDVLNDLPPKIVQDYPCPLSSLQACLYEDFSRTVKDQFASKNAPSNSSTSPRCGAFQILSYLRKLCDHPCLVVDEKHPNFDKISSQLSAGDFGECRLSNDYRLSGKMVALKQLLSECGIGRQVEADDEEPEQAAISQHRALIFCQFKSVIQLISGYFDSGVFGQSIGYRRLDGDIPPIKRQAVVDTFNSDPSIDVLLLSTQVGGLGLNLTGADVVIFVDHDWNPATDLQAMDRAHRIGQQRTVNVYRLITTGTLEEKIMRLQQFKTRTADVLIREENRSLMSMATDQLLDLLTLDAVSSDGGTDQPHHQSRKNSTSKKVTPTKQEPPIDLPSLWDQSQYDEAFDYNTFISSLKQ